MMQDLDTTSFLFIVPGVIVGVVAIYYAFGTAREWLGPWGGATNDTIHRVVVPDLPLDGHIATQWTEGRVRLDFLLAMMKKLRLSLEQEVETLSGLDHADPLYESEARKMVKPNLRRFTFDRHLRDECRMLILSLQFCAHDLAESQGLDMTQKLSVLAEIRAAFELVDRG